MIKVSKAKGADPGSVSAGLLAEGLSRVRFAGGLFEEKISTESGIG